MNPLEKLSPRERQILVLIRLGLSDKQIALRLHLSWRTITTYNQRIFFKLGVLNRVRAALFLEKHGRPELRKQGYDIARAHSLG